MGKIDKLKDITELDFKRVVGIVLYKFPHFV